MLRLTLASRPTTENADYVCTSWRGDARHHCSAETVTQLVKKLLTFCGTQRFITTFIRPSHWALSTANPIYCTFSQPSSLRIILILTSHLRIDLTSCFFLQCVPDVLLTPASSFCNCLYSAATATLLDAHSLLSARFGPCPLTQIQFCVPAAHESCTELTYLLTEESFQMGEWH
jgi:hypothetical protein